jgi:hypothetical protein
LLLLLLLLIVLPFLLCASLQLQRVLLLLHLS